MQHHHTIVPAGEFKAHCLELMDKVKGTGGSYTITKRGVPVAQLVPIKQETKDPYGCLKGTATILTEIMSPIDETWHANQ
jgi:prevent-host-death family protein